MKRSKILVPEVHGFKSARDFLRAFVEQNKQADARRSIRFFAKRFGWPIAFITDVVHGRKRLSLLRTIEFCHSLELDAAATEHLIWLALADADEKTVSAYAKAQVALSDSVKDTAPRRPSDREFLASFEACAVREAIRWARRRLAPAQIVELLPTLPLSEAQVEDIVESLLRQKLLEFDGDKLVGDGSKTIIIDDRDTVQSDLSIHGPYVDHFKRFFGNVVPPAQYFSGMVELPLDRFEDVKRRMLALRNWLFNLKFSHPGAKTTIFQLHAHVFPVVDDRKLVDG